jgi:hypothetical protein
MHENRTNFAANEFTESEDACIAAVPRLQRARLQHRGNRGRLLELIPRQGLRSGNPACP